MPSAQSENPYSLLERSFHDAPLLKAHKTLPRRRDELHDFFPASAPVRTSSYADDETSTEISNDDVAPLASPPVVNGHDSGLPPTPPSASHDGDDKSNTDTPQYADGVVSSLLSKKPSVRTPINQRSPPTPEPSPPRTTEFLKMPHPQPPPTLRYPSSRADSFTTAKSHLESDDDSSQSQFSYHDAPTPLARPTGDPSVQTYDNNVSALETENGEDDMTPTERNPSGQPERLVSPINGTPDARRGKQNQVPNREWDTNLMRNVTVRRRRLPRTPPEQTSPDDELSPISVMKRGATLRERAENGKRASTEPSLETSAKDIGWPNEVNIALNKHLNDTESRRFSTTSNASTVVEALVVATPPRRNRMLRHAGKNLALRSSSDSVFGDSADTHSNRTSLNLDDVPPHRLVHKRSRIPERRNRDSIGSDFGPNVSTNASPVITRQRQDSIPVLVIPEPAALRPALTPKSHVKFHSLTNQMQSQSQSRTAPAPGYFDVPKRTRKASNETSSSSISKSKQQEQRPSTSEETKRRSFTAPAGVNGSSDRVTLEYSPKAIEGKGFRRSSGNQPELRKKESLLSTPESSESVSPSTPVPAAAEPTQLTRAKQLLQEGPAKSPQERPNTGERSDQNKNAPQQESPVVSSQTHPDSAEKSNQTREASRQERPVTSPRSHLSPDRASDRTEEIHRPSIDRAMSSDNTRKSLDSVPVSPHHGRTSFDRSTIRTEEHALARHHWAQTPFSQMSDTGDPLEVSEATAVSIYPHNNNSLLVVQQVARSGTLSHKRTLSSPEPSLSRERSQDRPATPPTLTFRPSTPPQQIITHAATVDSPLKNPRKPPEPPAFKIIPPTPAEELERELTGPSAIQLDENRGPPPTRRQAFVQRARRYSDTIIQPILRTTSIRRNPSVSRRAPRRAPSVSSAKQKAEENNLHPFWKPRGFWDDLSDSDAELDDDMALEGVPVAGDRLPSGGDTSDVGGNTGDRGRGNTYRNPTHSMIDRQYADLEREKALERQRRRIGALGRRLTNGFKGSGGFLIGNSLGVERHGSNNRRHYIEAPLALRTHSSRRRGAVGKQASRGSLRSSVKAPSVGRRSPPAFATSPAQARALKNKRRELVGGSTPKIAEPTHTAKAQETGGGSTSRSDSPRRAVTIPGFGSHKGWSVEYVGLSGLREKLAERKAEKRREQLRGKIGRRFYWEGPLTG